MTDMNRRQFLQLMAGATAFLGAIPASVLANAKPESQKTLWAIKQSWLGVSEITVYKYKVWESPLFGFDADNPREEFECIYQHCGSICVEIRGLGEIKHSSSGLEITSEDGKFICSHPYSPAQANIAFVLTENGTFAEALLK